MDPKKPTVLRVLPSDSAIPYYFVGFGDTFWFNPLYVKDPIRQPPKGTTMETIGRALVGCRASKFRDLFRATRV